MTDMDFALFSFFDTHETILKLNVKTGELVFLKHKENNIPLNVSLSQEKFVAEYFSKIEVHPDDLYKFDTLLNLEALENLCREKQGGALFSFRTFRNGEYKWIRIIISIPSNFSDAQPCILLFRRDLPSWEADQEEALDTFQKKIHKIVKHNLTTNTMRIVRQRPSEEYIKRKHSKMNLLSEVWLIEEGLIHPDDIQHFKHFTDRQFIIDYFHEANEELSFFYRRKIGSFFRWVRLSITRSTEYAENNQIFLYIIEDIDMVLTNLLDQNGSFQYSRLKSAQNSEKEIYYDNLLHVLSFFTQKYLDFYMVDLKKDLYTMYKFRPENVSGDFPYVGSYSEMASHQINDYLPSGQKEALLPFTSSEALRERLLDKASIEYVFTLPGGQMAKTTCTKIESLNGVPTKVICCTMPYQQDRKLKVKTFGNFAVLDESGKQLKFTRRQGKELLAYLVDRQGYPVSSQDIIEDVFERDPDNLNALKYVSTIYRSAAKDLEKAGYPDILVKEWNSLRVNTEKLDCDYYHLLNGDASYLHQYHNEYMKEYSWAEETNAEILHYSSR